MTSRRVQGSEIAAGTYHFFALQGTYYANDDHKKNAYHYHNTCVLSLQTRWIRCIDIPVRIHGDRSDGSVFYRYPDGSEYYRRKNGNITFRPPEDLAESAEGVDPTATPAPADADRARRPWCDWPPQLNLTVKTDGSSVFIRDNSGSAVTFEPVGSGAKVDLAPVYDRSVSFSIMVIGCGER